jgi:hypothetical protein
MHVYKFLETRGWAPGTEGAARFEEQAGNPEPKAEPEEESRTVGATGRRVDPETSGNGAGWHSRPPGWAMRWEGSSLTLIEE